MGGQFFFKNFMILTCILFCFSPGQTFVFKSETYIFICNLCCFCSFLRPEDRVAVVHVSSIFFNTSRLRARLRNSRLRYSNTLLPYRFLSKRGTACSLQHEEHKDVMLSWQMILFRIFLFW